ncbi:hypothetical protein BDN71DRAFT_904477 [Pleurotus eryngii]|uniref:Uncharacterized protein n=1 Tax=Pleurotus eryngii TaxID=5323 RepID=A0A9P5ZYS1_PLEER|nr:hypothetical protein BDN71DRAFT_904477 [Pleurotus eryngii]
MAYDSCQNEGVLTQVQRGRPLFCEMAVSLQASSTGSSSGMSFTSVLLILYYVVFLQL